MLASGASVEVRCGTVPVPTPPSTPLRARSIVEPAAGYIALTMSFKSHHRAHLYNSLAISWLLSGF
jgi:hypothetical protein